MMTRVLVIEDDPDITRAVGIVLSRAGYEVSSATEGRAGLRIFSEQCPGLVVLDVGLPVLDGWQVLEGIREFSDVPVLMLSAHGLETDKVRGLRSGADDYMTKPFSNSEFLARVDAVLHRARSRRGPATGR
jgi:DNA-binding response OmpR family regulator